MKLAPKTLSGALHNLNKGACDWGWQGQLAYGCQNLVVVVDPRTVQTTQTLDRHKGYVVKVKWARENYHHDLASPYTLRLASADYNGHIIIWDVAQASIRAQFSDSSKPIADMEWLVTQDASHDLLAVLHPPYSLVLWNADTGTKLWKKSYTETLNSFAFDPFDPTKIAFLGQDCIVFVDDFSVSRTPSSNGKKYYISSPSSQADVSRSSSSDKLEKKSTKSTLKKVSDILVGDTGKRSQDEECVALNECLQLVYHQACRHHLILLYPREILILDLEINQTVGIVPMERTGVPFLQVLPLRQRDALMCLHENGSVTVRMRRRAIQPTFTMADSQDESSLTLPPVDITYDLRCQSDPMRLTRHNKVFGVSCCPVSEMKVALLLSDSRVLFWELKTVDYQEDGSLQPQSPLFTPGQTLPQDFAFLSTEDTKLPLFSGATVPRTALTELIGHVETFVTENQVNQNKHGVLLKFTLTGLLSGVAGPPFIIRMCPPLTTKNWAVYQPLLALGTQSGAVQIYNLGGSFMHREFSIHTCTVRGIEWVSLHSFMSWAYPTPVSGNTVKNEISITDIQTGRSTAIRTNRDEESQIEMIKISYLKQYFVIVFKEKPFELWDLRTCTVLRQMPKHCPTVTALEWSPSHNLKSLKKKLAHEAGAHGGSQHDVSTPSTPGPETSTRGGDKTINITAKEHFVFTDNNGLLYHFVVEGNVIKNGSQIPPDGGMGQITSIAWKGETLVLGDVDGNLNLWNLKAKVSRAIPTHRGWIRKVKFAPGRDNMKLLILYNDGAEIWDAKDGELLSAIRSPKEISKITDCDWAASDKPALACADGCIRVMDLNFKNGSSAIEDNSLQEPLFSPHLIPAKAAMTVKYLLQHQPWNDNFELSLAETDQNREWCGIVNEQLQLIDQLTKDYIPESHFGTAQRCLQTARLFGDESECTFWAVALHYLRSEKAEPMSRAISRSASQHSEIFIPTTPARESQDLLDLGGEGGAKSPRGSKSWMFIKDRPLESCYDILCDNMSFQKYQLDRLTLHDSKRSTYEHTKKCAENLMLLGQADRAVQLLLETEADNNNYYVDSLRACLVASIRSSGASQSTIKLVSTHLISSGKLSEGVQLLCLIDKGLDACRYLQTYGQWHQAAWLAKSILDYSECSEVMKRWADHLSTPQINQKSFAVLVMLSLGQFVKVIEMLYNMRYFDRAALFIESLQEFDLLVSTDETKPLIEAVFLEYARMLLPLENRKGAQYYCQLAGEKGKQLLQSVQQVYDDKS